MNPDIAARMYVVSEMPLRLVKDRARPNVSLGAGECWTIPVCRKCHALHLNDDAGGR